MILEKVRVLLHSKVEMLKINQLLIILFAMTFFGQASTAKTQLKDLPGCENLLLPTVYELNMVSSLMPQHIVLKPSLSSPAMTDPWLNLGRRAVAFPDFKFLSDLEPIPVSEPAKRAIVQNAKFMRRRLFNRLIAKGVDRRRAVSLVQAAYARSVINQLYRIETGLKPFTSELVKPKLEINWSKEDLPPGFTTKENLAQAYQYVEKTWATLARQSPEASGGSLLPSPYPVLIAGGRFKESYYWDAYFGALGLIATDRYDIAAAQLENFLHMIQVYGQIPNGFRDYYLTRSQPPVISLMAFLIYDNAPSATKAQRDHRDRWMLQRVYPLLKKDYQEFWMKKRVDLKTGLNFYSDDLNKKRPERHSNDNESELGETFRDVRGEAESGLDHTDASMGASSQVATVGLNSFMYAYEKNLERLAEMAGDQAAARTYSMASQARLGAVTKYLWDDQLGVFRNYHLKKQKQGDILSSDMLTALYTGLATVKQAARVRDWVIHNFEKPGGLMASTSQSGKQWDGNHGWAPFQVMGIQGLANYGYGIDARRIARKWVSTLADIYKRTGYFYEKIDVVRQMAPQEDNKKYPTQTGFLWTNASYVWACKFLGIQTQKLAHD